MNARDGSIFYSVGSCALVFSVAWVCEGHRVVIRGLARDPPSGESGKMADMLRRFGGLRKVGWGVFIGGVALVCAIIVVEGARVLQC